MRVLIYTRIKDISMLHLETPNNCIKEYHHDNGDVYLCRGEHFYYFVIERQLERARTLVHERGHLDFICANEFFNVAVRYIRGEIEWTEPARKFSCGYNPIRSRACTDVNCPRKLGGPDYRYIFGTSCPFRKPSRTR